jgi:hypothetical protein
MSVVKWIGGIALENNGLHGLCIFDWKADAAEYLIYAIIHVAWMVNSISSKFKNRLASPFLLIYGVGHNEGRRIPLFSMRYFHHEKDGDQTLSKHQASTMDGIIVDCSPTLDAIVVYNPCNWQYYEPDSYQIDSYCLLGLVYPAFKYDGDLFCLLLKDNTPSFEEKKYTLRMQVKRIDP